MHQVETQQRSRISPFSVLKDIVIGGLITLGIIFTLLVIGTSRRPHAGPGQTGNALVAVGDEGRPQSGEPEVTVAVDEQALSDLIKAGALSSAASGGRFFSVSDRIEVRVVESKVNAQKIRILSGSKKGKSGWVSPDWVRPRE